MGFDDEAARARAIRAAFEALKEDFAHGRLPAVAGRLCGEAEGWGRELLAIYRGEGREQLAARDSLTRFWVLRYRGMPSPADLAGAPAGAAFVMALTAFPYLDPMLDLWSLGASAGPGGEGGVAMRRLTDGEEDGTVVVAEPAGGPGGWRFDLMPLYRDKAAALDVFISAHYGGSFDRFIDDYVAEHDLDFDLAQAWRPLQGDGV